MKKEQDKQAIRELVDLGELIAENVRPLRGPLLELRGRCPLCESGNPRALRVNAKIGRWYCEVCGGGGDCFDWVVATTDFNLGQAVELLARWVGLRPRPPSSVLGGNRSP